MGALVFRRWAGCGDEHDWCSGSIARPSELWIGAGEKEMKATHPEYTSVDQDALCSQAVRHLSEYAMAIRLCTSFGPSLSLLLREVTRSLILQPLC